MMTNQQGKNFAYQLTMEYIKQNNMLQCNKEDIPKCINDIVEVENIIFDCVEKNFHNFKFL